MIVGRLESSRPRRMRRRGPWRGPRRARASLRTLTRRDGAGEALRGPRCVRAGRRLPARILPAAAGPRHARAPAPCARAFARPRFTTMPGGRAGGSETWAGGSLRCAGRAACDWRRCAAAMSRAAGAQCSRAAAPGPAAAVAGPPPPSMQPWARRPRRSAAEGGAATPRRHDRPRPSSPGPAATGLVAAAATARKAACSDSEKGCCSDGPDLWPGPALRPITACSGLRFRRPPARPGLTPPAPPGPAAAGSSGDGPLGGGGEGFRCSGARAPRGAGGAGRLDSVAGRDGEERPGAVRAAGRRRPPPAAPRAAAALPGGAIPPGRTPRPYPEGQTRPAGPCLPASANAGLLGRHGPRRARPAGGPAQATWSPRLHVTRGRAASIQSNYNGATNIQF